jgi:hypothetical protein
MKRASLKSVKVSVLSNPSQDVTDRILKTDEGEKTQLAPSPRAAAAPAKPSKPRRSRTPDPSPTDSSAQPTTPSPAVSAPEADVLSEAIAQTRLALSALNAARDSAPARYNLGIRYRLDSLAHHIEQVAEFVTSHPPT